jgi:hypothetical protein
VHAQPQAHLLGQSVSKVCIFYIELCQGVICCFLCVGVGTFGVSGAEAAWFVYS